MEESEAMEAMEAMEDTAESGAMEDTEDSEAMEAMGAMEATLAYAPLIILMAPAAWEDYRADIMVVLMVMAMAIILDIRPLVALAPPAAAFTALLHFPRSLKWLSEIKNQYEKIKTLEYF